MRKLQLQTENLEIDFISFSKELSYEDAVKELPNISLYLDNHLGMNSSLIGQTTEVLIWKPKNLHSAFFTVIQSNSWTGLQVSFAGENAAYFYQFLKSKRINFELFGFRHLSRLDIRYYRPSLTTDDSSVVSFINECLEQLVSSRRNWKLLKNRKGLIFTFGNRRSSKFYRLYEKSGGLQFELEIKKLGLEIFQNLLDSHNFQEFEHELIQQFYEYSSQLLIQTTCYTDWLTFKLRRLKPLPHDSLVAEYLNKFNDRLLTHEQKVQFFTLLQFISFLRTLTSRVYNLEDSEFVVVMVEFYVKDYFQYIGIESISQYQLQKFVQFLRDLTNISTLVTNFADPGFQAIAVFPKVKLTKHNKFWFAKLVTSSELYNFQYPFALPKAFLSYRGKFDVETKLALLQAICVNHSKKEFLVDAFLNEYNIPNQKKTYLKQTLISLLEILIQTRVIQDNLTFYNKKGIAISIELTPKALTKIKFHIHKIQ